MPNSDDLLQFIDDIPEPPPAGSALSAGPLGAAPWRILVVDDDDDVHESSAFALRGLRIAGRPLELLHARSAAQALALLQAQPQVAVVLLDVVMESQDAGLALVDSIRAQPALQHTRIILRTGQPGQAPELDTIRRYDINDYKTKSELTRGKLYVTLTAAVRAYDQLRRLEAGRQGLEKVIAASNQFIAEQGLASFAEGVILQLAGLLGVDPEGLLCACTEAARPGAEATPAAEGTQGEGYIVIAAAGRYRHLIRHRLDALDQPQILGALRAALDERRSHFADDHAVLFFAGRGMRDFAAYVATAQPVADLDRDLLQVFCTNITLCAANVALVARLRMLAYFDPLLGLPNRAAVIDHLQAHIRAGTAAGQALAYIEIDQFAEANDVFGPAFGDCLLKALALRLAAALPAPCHVARVGGNTFSVFGPADLVQEPALRRLLQAPLDIDGVQRLLSVTVAVVPCDEAELSDGAGLLMDAAITLKHARAGGDGRSARYSAALGAAARERTRLLHGLHRALGQARLSLHYQPKVDLASGALVGLEALMRWRGDDGALVSPERFIPVAEQSGLIVPLGDWALRTALADLVVLAAAGHGALHMAVNVSAVQFAHPDYLAQLDAALAASTVAPAQLELEITESVAVIGLDRLAALLAQIRERGVGVAIDDFGTGFSSLSYLDRLPADRLKIDRAFVDLLATDRPGARIARMIVPLGHQLGMRVLAEGVETADQARALREMGCDEVQGYAVARPMDLDQLQQWLRGRPAAVAGAFA
jgi:diguanylate cyclase (GGDEF)-like protein